MKIKALDVLLNGRHIGVLREEPTGKHTFTYDSDAPNAMPLSLSMPRKAEPWSGNPIEAYIDGILPDDPAIRQRIGRLYGVNPRNPFALLTAVGLDCGGGVQFVVPDTPRIRSALGGRELLRQSVRRGSGQTGADHILVVTQTELQRVTDAIRTAVEHR